MKIRLENVFKSIRNQVVLNNISLTFIGGKVYGICGHNGSGKTMLLRAVSGLINIDSGNIFIDDKILHKDIDFPNDLGLIIEVPSFFKYYTGFENLKFLSSIKNIIDDEKINQTLDTVGLGRNEKKTVSKYSLGMRQKLAIAQAIMEEPKILLLDEPINALDKESVKIFKNIILKEKEKGALILIATHNQRELDDIIDEYVYLSNGEIEEQ